MRGKLVARVSFAISVSITMGISASSQEPAYLPGAGPAARFAEAAGFYHYIYLCEGGLSKSLDAVNPSGPIGLCWNVNTEKLEMVDGKIVPQSMVSGVLKVSYRDVRFRPHSGGSTQPEPAELVIPREHVKFKHNPGKSFGFLSAAGSDYLYVLSAVCVHCVAGANAVDTSKTAQLDAEYDLLNEATNDFDVVFRRMGAVFMMSRVGINPAFEPKADADAATMKLYGDLNGKIAAACTEPDKSCVQQYAKYQECRAENTGANCGEVPSCSAQCLLKAGSVVSHVQTKILPNEDYLVYIPLPGPIPPAPVVGMGSMSKPSHEEKLKVLSGTVYVSGGEADGIILKKVSPAYPPIAKAAHVSGVVVLQGIIGTDGKVEQLEAISGPDLLKGAAIDAVKQWEYKPYLLNGVPTRVDTTITVNFNLSGGAD